MCGRYYVDDSVYAALSGMMRKTPGAGIRKRPENDICPTDTAPVIVRAESGVGLCFQHWGYPGIRKGQTIFNARAESVLEKGMFLNGIRRHRAAIPCARFYEWNRNKEKAEFYREDAAVLFMAGFFDRFPDGDRYIILTTEANESMAGTHDRMPLILEEREVPAWILDDGKTQGFLKKVPEHLQKRMEYEQQTFFL